jgi:arsenate reductase-like glutaredoxin family protein
MEERDLGTAPLSVKELEEMIGTRDYREFLNTRNELYREKDMKNHPPSRPEALRLMAQHPNLIKRPILVRDGKLLLGWDEAKAKGFY